MKTSLRWPPSRFAAIIMAIALAGLLLRVVFIFTIAPSSVSGDAYYYHHGANLLANGEGYIDPYRYNLGNKDNVTLANGEVVEVITPVGHSEPTAGHPPVYVTYLAVFSFFGLDSVRAHQLASAVLGAGSIILAGYLGRYWRNKNIGYIAAILTAVYANIWINDGLVLSETAAIFFAFLTSLVGLHFWRNPTRANAAWLGFVAAFAALSRAELVLFLPIVVIVVMWRSSLSWKERFIRTAIAGLIGLLTVAPWIIRNNIALEEFVTLSDGSGTVLVQANCYETYYGEKIGFWHLECGSPMPYGPNGELLDESQRDVVVRERAMEYIRGNTQRLVTVVVPARIARMWGVYAPVWQIRTDIVEGRPGFAAWLGFWQYVVLAPAAIAGAVITWRRKQPVLVIGLWAVLATFTAATAFGITRYRTAAEVSVVMFAAITAEALWLWWKRRETKEAAKAEAVSTSL